MAAGTSIARYRQIAVSRTRTGETPETLQKKAIKEFLTMTGWVWYPNTAGMGVKPGIPDLTAIKRGVVVQIEVKAPGGKQSKAQVDFMIDWRGSGGHYVLGGIDEVMMLLPQLCPNQ